MPSVRYAWAIRSQNDGEDFGTIQNLDGPFSAQSSMFPKGEVRSRANQQLALKEEDDWPAAKFAKYRFCHITNPKTRY